VIPKWKREYIAMTYLSRWIGGICLAVCVLLILAYAGWRYAERRSSATLSSARNSFERSINSDLQPRSNKSRAVQFLNAQKMRYIELPLQNGQLGYKRNDLWYRGAAETIEAITTSPIETPLYACNIHVDLKFDKSSELLGYRDSMTCKGPW
jgi:hypothetical protein